MSRLYVGAIVVGLLCLGSFGVFAADSSPAGGSIEQVVAGVEPTLIYDNVTNNGGINAAGACPAAQWDETIPFRSGAADDFVLPPSPRCTWSVSQVSWTGRYWGDGPTGGITGFRVLFWSDAQDLPAGGGALTPDDSQALASFEIVGNANETPSGVGAFDYMTALQPPIDLVPGRRYWVEIRALANFPPQWGWQVTSRRTGASPVHYFDILDVRAWTTISDAGDLAFQLFGEPKEINCDDGNACTTDSCDGAECVHEAISCDDGNACTEDSCDPATGCINNDASASCDDGNACTADSCDPAIGCVNTDTSATCDDGDACTTDSCDPATGCTFTALDCSDGNACTVDVCEEGSCKSGSPADFDRDGDADAKDFGMLHGCFVSVDTDLEGSGCGCMDLNNDGRVNLRDYGVFQTKFNGGK